MSIAFRSSTPSCDTETSSPVAVTAPFCIISALPLHSRFRLPSDDRINLSGRPHQSRTIDGDKTKVMRKKMERQFGGGRKRKRKDSQDQVSI